MSRDILSHEPSWGAVVILLAGAVIAAWGGSLAGGFVWEDEPLVLLNSDLSLTRLPQLLTRPWLAHDLAGGERKDTYRPVAALSLLADSLLWGRQPAGFHATNLLLHLAASLLVYRLGRQILGGTPGAGLSGLAAACLFAVHPASTNAVAHIAGRADILAALFTLAALLLHTRPAGGSSPAALAAAAACTALALLSKESAAIVPLLLILCDAIPAGPASPAATSWRERAKRWSPHLAVLCGASALRALLLDDPFGYFRPALPFARSLLTAPAAVIVLLGDLLRPGLEPRILHDIAPVASPLDGRLIAGLASAGALLALGALVARRRRESLPALLLAGTVLLPLTATFVGPSALDSAFPLAEANLYLPLTGMAAAIAVPLARILEWAASGGRRLGRGLAVGAPLACAALAWAAASESRAAGWRSEMTLFPIVRDQLPRSARAHYHLGRTLQKQGDFVGAISSYEQAVALDPSHVASLNNLAVLYEATGRLDRAAEAYRRALELEPEAPGVRFNLALLAYRKGRLEEAAAAFRDLIKDAPGMIEARIHLGETLMASGDTAGAIETLDQAARMAPASGEARARLGAALAMAGRREEGIALMSEALRLDPRDERVRGDLGAALTDAGRAAEALEVLDQALALRGADSRAHYNRGNALRALGRREEAVEAFTRAVAIDPAYTRALNNLGVTLYELGRVGEALAAYDALVRLEPDAARVRANRAVVLKALGRLDEARGEFRIAAALDPAVARAAGPRFEQMAPAAAPPRGP